MRLRFVVFLSIALAVPSFAAQYSLELQPEKTTIQWTLGDVLHTVRGTFNLKSGRIVFDNSTGAASGLVVVDVTSGKSGSDARDRRMHANVLESSKYPEATFVPDRLDGRLAIPGTSNVKLHGRFTIHGSSHEMNMNVQEKATDGRMDATITFDVPYVEWRMKDPSTFLLKVSKSVQFSIASSGTLKKD